jgi:hypothetical protein
MTEGQEHEWHIELDHMRAQVRYALNNLDDLPKREDVRGKLEVTLMRLNDLCEITQGASNENK